MRRRALLSAVAAGAGSLAGCAEGFPGEESEYAGLPADDRPDRTFAPDEVQRRVALASVDPVPGEHDLTIDVELRRAVVTGQETARVAVTTTNEGATRFFSMDGGRCAPFDRRDGESDDRALWLFQPGMRGSKFVGDPPMRVEPLWAIRHDEDGPPPGLVHLAYGCLPTRFETGESVPTEYRVWDGFHGAGYLPPGVHRFEDQIRIWESVSEDGETPDPAQEPTATFTWGLELRVEDPSG